MPNYHETFPKKHVVLPVIHVKDTDHAIRNASIAQEAGADGVFLISMRGMPHTKLTQVQRAVREQFGTWWIGVNYLDVPTVKVFSSATPAISGIWVDDARINAWISDQVEAEEIANSRVKSGWSGLYFGGVAFKYQEHVKDVALASQIATKYMDVVTTSGTGTGSAPDLEKITLMKARIGTHPLGIASGISPENVHNYKEVADCFLVATSLLTPDTEEFDLSRVRALVEAVRG